MEPSSLIFLAIIGVWAAYLVPHWLRRRDDLAQSRTRDRFSERLRVLPRRRRPVRSGTHRSGDPVLTSPRVVVDADGEFLYIPAERMPAAKAEHRSEPVHPSTSEPSSRPAVAAAGAEPAPATEPSVGLANRPPDLESALTGARVAARRRAVGMILLLVATLGSWTTATAMSLSAWAALPATGLLVLHALASRVAGLRSRATLTLLSAQLYAAELALSRPRRAVAEQAAEQAGGIAVQATPVTPERVTRRAAAVGAETWEPVPVPPPTYTLKPAVHRPEPAPLDLPATQPAAAAGVSRGALPRRAADIERILALESDVDELFEQPKVVNG